MIHKWLAYVCNFVVFNINKIILFTMIILLKIVPEYVTYAW